MISDKENVQIKNKPIRLVLPFPPSINAYWKHRVAGKLAIVYLSKEAIKFRQDVRSTVKFDEKFTGRVKVTINLFAPSKRSYDIDNRVKAILDSLTHIGLWNDDEQVDILIVKRGCIEKNNGFCVVEVEEL